VTTSITVYADILYKSYQIGDLPHSFTVNLPYICEQCGRCCRWRYPSNSFDIEILPFLGYSVDNEGKEKFFNDFNIVFEDGQILNTEPCRFYKINQCIIYPYRPENCKSYPLSDHLERNPITNEPCCPGARRFEQIETVLVIEKYDSIIERAYNSSIDGIIVEFPPSSEQWKTLKKDFHKSEPTDVELKLFLRVNPRTT
jgi:Fe-S-cluster containining protein